MTSFTASVIMATMTPFLSAATPGLFTPAGPYRPARAWSGAARHLSAGFHYADVGRSLRKQMRVLGDGQDDPDIMTIDMDGYFRMSRNHHGPAVDGLVTVALASGASRIAAQIGAHTVHVILILSKFFCGLRSPRMKMTVAFSMIVGPSSRSTGVFSAP